MILSCVLGVYRYEKESGRADAPNTSSLSPYLHFGQLSPRWLLWDAKGARCRPPKFQRKLAWRDLAYWQLTLFPDLPWESLRPPYKVELGFGYFDSTLILSKEQILSLYHYILSLTRPLVFAGPAVEQRSWPPEGLAARANRLPSGGCSHEAAVADRLDEQLHETCGGILSHSIPPPALARRLSLVPGETLAQHARTQISYSNAECNTVSKYYSPIVYVFRTP